MPVIVGAENDANHTANKDIIDTAELKRLVDNFWDIHYFNAENKESQTHVVKIIDTKDARAA